MKIDEVFDALERIYEGTEDADSDWQDYDAIRRFIEQAGAVKAERDKLLRESQTPATTPSQEEAMEAVMMLEHLAFPECEGGLEPSEHAEKALDFIERAGAVPRRRGSWQDELAVMFSSAPKQEAEPDWLTHVSDQPPADLAPVQIVIYERWLRNERVHKHSTVEDTSWHPGLRYRPVYGPSGLPLVSAEGLEPCAQFVATDKDGEPLQFLSMPRHDTTTGHWCSAGVLRGILALAPYTHARPGDWRLSLMEVQR